MGLSCGAPEARGRPISRGTDSQAFQMLKGMFQRKFIPERAECHFQRSRLVLQDVTPVMTIDMPRAQFAPLTRCRSPLSPFTVQNH